MVQTVNIRTLKDKLSAYLRDVRRGDVVLITDRGEVVAELRRPLSSAQAMDVAAEREQRLAEQGVLKLGLPNSPEAYLREPTKGINPDAIDEALNWTRGGR